MASKSRAKAPKKERNPNPLADLGLFNIPDLLDDNEDESDVDESALESELEALLSGKAPPRPVRHKKPTLPVDVEKLAAECMKDPDDEDEGNLSTDEDLLNELQKIAGLEDSPEGETLNREECFSEKESPKRSIPSVTNSSSVVSILEERLKLYNEALVAVSALGDNSKKRRYGRAVKTLEGLLKSAKQGMIINEEDIPPVVRIPTKDTSSLAPDETPKHATDECLIDFSADSAKNDLPISPQKDANIAVDVEIPHKPLKESPDIAELTLRRNQYKVAALHAKRAGDKVAALNYIKISKSFDAVIEALNSGQPVDLLNIPPPPPGLSAGTTQLKPYELKKTQDEIQSSSAMEAAALSAASEPEDPSLFSAPPPPTTVLEALKQRLEKYKDTRKVAENEGNSGKVRRLQRIIKQYESAIKDYQAGKPVDFDALPAPPGFAPIPVNQQQSKSETVPSHKKEPVAPVKKDDSSNKASVQPAGPSSQKPLPERKKLQRTNTSVVDKQLEFLLERQKLFRQAALEAKRNGDIQQAKEYLRMSKGFDSMIEATRCGLPIDATSIPTPPQMESDFVVIEASECVENTQGNQTELLESLEKDLSHQIQVCTRNKDHFMRLGDVSSASKFERLGLESRKDLSVIQHLKKTSDAVPRFHYETRLFSIVQCHTDLGDNDLEVTVERGINLPGKPDDLDSYVKLEFPIPADAPQRAKTHTIRDTNNPSFQEQFKFDFNRKSRAQLRQFKRQALKLEVWAKGGFLRADTLLGTAHIKLVDLESKCTIHDSFSLYEGRKACGGKIEAKIRIRDPLLVKQVEEIKEKWLVLGS